MLAESNPEPLQPNGSAGLPVTKIEPVTLFYSQDESEMTQLLRVIRRRGWLVLGVAIAATSAMWGWTLTRTPIYRGEFRVLVEPVADGDRSERLLQETVQTTPQFDYATQIEVLRSPVLLQPIAATLQTDHPEISYSVLLNRLIVTRLRDTKVLSVTYLDPNPETIKAALDAVSQGYLRYSFQQRQKNLQQGVQFVDDQLPELRSRVNTLQVKLEKFRQQYSLIDPESRGTDLSTLIGDVEKQRQETQTQLTEARSLYGTLQSQLGLNVRDALAASTLSESPRYQDILNQVHEVETQIAAESALFQATSPNILVLQDKRDRLLPLMDQEAERILGTMLASQDAGVDGNLTPISLELSRQLISTANQILLLESRSTALGQVEEQMKQEFSLVPALARQYTDLQRELSIATDSLNRFLTTRETLQIDAAKTSIPWELISGPVVTSTPISPNVPRNLLLGAIAGTTLGLAAALVREKMDHVFHSSEELKILSQLPVLGVIPYVQELYNVKQSSLPQSFLPQLPLRHVTEEHSGMGSSTLGSPSAGRPNVGKAVRVLSNPAEPESISRSNHSSPFLESMRSLYANIRFLNSDQAIRSLVISSAVPGEGKSTTALHLAEAAAAMGQQVLLVDADLRCPQVHTRLELSNLRGLSHVLTGAVGLRQVIQRSPTDKNLYIITAGAIPPDPVKLLSSNRMQALMQQLHGRFSLVIYDMPPILGFADSSLLAAHTDGMVLVVGLGKTNKASVIQALDTLKIAPISILGLVANGIRSYTTQTYGYDQYQAYYSAQNFNRPTLTPQSASPVAAFPSVASSLPPSLSTSYLPNSSAALPWQTSDEPDKTVSLQPRPLPADASHAMPFSRIRFFLLTGVGFIVLLTLLVQIFQKTTPAPNDAPSVSSPSESTEMQPKAP